MKTLRDESGQTLIMVALSMTVLLGFAAFATDVGVLLRQKRLVQTAADSAAIAGATALKVGGNATTAGRADAALNGFNNGTNGITVTINTPVTDDSNPSFNNAGFVEAIVSQSASTPFIGTFMHLFNPSSSYTGMKVSARAVATDTIVSNPCVNVQNPTLFDPAVSLGGHSLVATPHCGVLINGNVDMGGSSRIAAAYLSASGTIQNGGSSSISGGQVVQNAAPTSDPLAYLSQTGNQPTINGTTCTSPSGAACFLNAPLTGALSPGVYVFTHSPTLTGAVSGTGITIFVSGTIPFDFIVNGTINLSPPDSGIYKGILIDAPTDIASAQTNVCRTGSGQNRNTPGELYFDFGSSTTTLNGVVYAPSAHMFLQDEGATMTLNADLVIGTLCQQSADISIEGYLNGNSPITRIALVE